MTQWYYADANGQRQGPFSAEELESHVHHARLGATSLVWRDGLPDWQPLSTLATELDLVLDTPVPAAADAPYAPPAADLAPSPPVVLAGPVVQAGFWKRVAAYFIDYVVLMVANYALMIPIGILMAIFGGVGASMDSGAGSAVSILVMVIGYLLILAINIMYPAWMHASRHQATLGKMAVGIKVVRVDGERISLARAIGRIFATILSSLTLGIGFIMAAFTQRKQALHDMVCDTLVVDKWAFTAHPERQQEGLGTVTIVILCLVGVLLLVFLVAVLAAIGIAASDFS